VWLKQWSSAAQDPTQPNRTPLYLGVYGAVALLGLASLVFGIWFIYMILVPTAGKNLHDTLLETVVQYVFLSRLYAYILYYALVEMKYY